MVQPTSTETVIDAAVTTAKTAQVIAHVKNNNIAYLVGLLISYQTGVLEQVFTYGSAVCS